MYRSRKSELANFQVRGENSRYPEPRRKVGGEVEENLKFHEHLEDRGCWE